MQARMNNIATVFPEIIGTLTSLNHIADKAGLSPKVLGLVHLRASQVNGCSVCVDMHWQYSRNNADDTEERLFAVAAWRDAPFFTDAERAALALAESVTRLSDRTDPVPDAIWNDAAKHYDEKGLAGLLIAIATINVWNRLNVATRQIAGIWKPG